MEPTKEEETDRGKVPAGGDVEAPYYVYLLLGVNVRPHADGGETRKMLSYVGYTTNLEQRLKEHNTNKCKSTRGKVWEMIGVIPCKDKATAMSVERWFKEGKTKQKKLTWNSYALLTEDYTIFCNSTLREVKRWEQRKPEKGEEG